MYSAVQVPGVRVKREHCLRTALHPNCGAADIESAVVEGLPWVGISSEVLDTIVRSSIGHELIHVTSASTLTVIPGRLGMLGTVPADHAQYVRHMLRISQKLALVYGWLEPFEDDGDSLDNVTRSVLILFLGVMAGTQSAQVGVKRLTEPVGANAGRQHSN